MQFGFIVTSTNFACNGGTSRLANSSEPYRVSGNCVYTKQRLQEVLVSIGDFIDLYFQLLQNRKFGSILQRFIMSEKGRTKSWWSYAPSLPRNWWSVPAVVRRWQERISGNPDLTYMEYIGRNILNNRSGIRLLSPGCGEGEKECKIAEVWPNWHITGFDLNPHRIAKACENAKNRTLSNIVFQTTDINACNLSCDPFDIILFDSSLHHFTDFKCLLPRFKNLLAEDGLLVINEYVGPDRFYWSKAQLHAANKLLRTIPTQYRTRINTSSIKKNVFRPGWLRMVLSDPSEAAESSKIIPSIRSNFHTIQEVTLGGNLLHLVLKDIAHNFINDNNESKQLLHNLFNAEDRFLENNSSDFIFGIYS